MSATTLARICLLNAPAQTVVISKAIQVGPLEVFIRFNYKGADCGDVFSAAAADIDTLCDTDLTTGQYNSAVLGAVTDQNAQPSITSVSTGTGS